MLALILSRIPPVQSICRQSRHCARDVSICGKFILNWFLCHRYFPRHVTDISLVDWPPRKIVQHAIEDACCRYPGPAQPELTTYLWKSALTLWEIFSPPCSCQPRLQHPAWPQPEAAALVPPSPPLHGVKFILCISLKFSLSVMVEIYSLFVLNR
jgi:hypothetical protein